MIHDHKQHLFTSFKKYSADEHEKELNCIYGPLNWLYISRELCFLTTQDIGM